MVLFTEMVDMEGAACRGRKRLSSAWDLWSWKGTHGSGSASAWLTGSGIRRQVASRQREGCPECGCSLPGNVWKEER